jgi:hypothetical protein
MENIHYFYRQRVITMYNTLNHFRNIGIPVELAFWNAIDSAHAQIQNGLLYNPMVIHGTAGLHVSLSNSPTYNPYQTAFNQIVSENRMGWDARVNLPNAYSSTSYYMFRVQDTFHLVWINSHGEINELCSDSWLENITVPSVTALVVIAPSPPPSSTSVVDSVAPPSASPVGDTGGTLYPLPPSLYFTW